MTLLRRCCTSNTLLTKSGGPYKLETHVRAKQFHSPINKLDKKTYLELKNLGEPPQSLLSVCFYFFILYVG